MMLKNPSEEEIRRHAEQIEMAILNSGADFIEDLEKVVSDFAVRVNFALGEVVEGDYNRDQLTRIREIAKVGEGLEDALLDAGFDDLAESFGDRLRVVSDQASRYYDLFGVEPSKAVVPSELLEGWVNFSTQELTEIADRKILRPIRRALLQAQVGNRTYSEAKKDIKSAMEQEGITTKRGEPFTDAQTNVFVADSMRRMNRQTVIEGANRLKIKLVQYIGPNDKKTSEQCQFLLRGEKGDGSGVWKEKNLKAGIHPGLKQNPLVAGGHFNCRHNFWPISEEGLEEFGS